MARSNYTYEKKTCSGRKVLVIEDLNLGRTSLTNDIENVIHEISVSEQINAHDYMIVYKDSEGIWDGFDAKTNDFIFLNELTWKAAVQEYISKQLLTTNNTSS